MSEELSHLDERGRARMVDVGDKRPTRRECVARAEVHMAPDTLARIAEGKTPKGDVLATARLAGIQAAKRTADWIPLCHPVALDVIEIDFAAAPSTSCLRIEARARAQARTGVEMEALVAVSAAGLTVYDMCKAIDRGIAIQGIRLMSKSGGKSGSWSRCDPDPAPGPAGGGKSPSKSSPGKGERP